MLYQYTYLVLGLCCLPYGYQRNFHHMQSKASLFHFHDNIQSLLKRCLRLFYSSSLVSLIPRFILTLTSKWWRWYAEHNSLAGNIQSVCKSWLLVEDKPWVDCTSSIGSFHPGTSNVWRLEHEIPNTVQWCQWRYSILRDHVFPLAQERNRDKHMLLTMCRSWWNWLVKDMLLNGVMSWMVGGH